MKKWAILVLSVGIAACGDVTAPSPEASFMQASVSGQDSLFWDEYGVLETSDGQGNELRLIRNGPETQPTSVDLYRNQDYVGTFAFSWQNGAIVESTYTNGQMWASIDPAGVPTGSTWGVDPCWNHDNGSRAENDGMDPVEGPVGLCDDLRGSYELRSRDDACDAEEKQFWVDVVAAVGLDQATDLRGLVKFVSKKAIALGQVVTVLQAFKAAAQGMAWAACELAQSSSRVGTQCLVNP